MISQLVTAPAQYRRGPERSQATGVIAGKPLHLPASSPFVPNASRVSCRRRTRPSASSARQPPLENQISAVRFSWSAFRPRSRAGLRQHLQENGKSYARRLPPIFSQLRKRAGNGEGEDATPWPRKPRRKSSGDGRRKASAPHHIISLRAQRSSSGARRLRRSLLQRRVGPHDAHRRCSAQSVTVPGQQGPLRSSPTTALPSPFRALLRRTHGP